jgi:methyl-accepting chemotaxis protein
MRTKIILGFMIVIVLLVAVSTTAILQFGTAGAGFEQYRGLARDTNLAGRLQANMLMVRMNVKDFLITGSDKDREQYAEYLNIMNGFLEESQTEIKDPKRAASIDEIDAEVIDYEESFAKVVEYRDERNDHVMNYLDIQGPLMENTLTSILESANKDGDDLASFNAAIAMKHLLLARLYMVKFLDSNEQSAVDRVHKEMAKMEDYLVVLDQELQNPERRAYLAAVQAAKIIYMENFDAKPFMDELNVQGLPWKIIEMSPDETYEVK